MGTVCRLCHCAVVLGLFVLIELEVVRLYMIPDDLYVDGQIKGYASSQASARISYVYGNAHSKTKRVKRSLPMAVKIDFREEELTYEIQGHSSVLHPDAVISEWEGDKILGRSSLNPGVVDCVLIGHLQANTGDRIVLSRCNKTRGWFEYGDSSYSFEDTGHTQSRDSDQMEAFVTRTERSTMTRDIPPGSPQNARVSREATNGSVPNITIETVVILDESYVAKLADNGGKDYLVDAVQLKWTGVQAEWGKSDQLGYDVRLSIKEIAIWRTNPDWYHSSTVLSDTLKSVCNGAFANGNFTSYDHIHLYTGVSRTDVSGKAYTGVICRPQYKCAVSAATGLTEYVISAHELGHVMGMGHDGDMGCPSPNDGIMGSKTSGWSTCSVKSMHDILKNQLSACVYNTSIQSNSPFELRRVWPGMMFTKDEICMKKNGNDYRYRRIPVNTIGDCGLYSCVNMNASSPSYGLMFNYLTPTDGSYCGDRKVCSTQLVDGYYQCIGWNETGLQVKLFKVQLGGWSEWGPMTSCSRTCGTGIQHRSRACTKPQPLNSHDCVGDAYDAKICNVNPCIADPVDISELIVVRATEVCSRLKSSDLYRRLGLDGSHFLSTGSAFNKHEFGQCEVKCDINPGQTVDFFQRFSLMPDGTRCDLPGSNSFLEDERFHRQSGRHGRCVQGYCYAFGCNGVSEANAPVFDGCGVCGGDNSTCRVRENVFGQTPSKGSTVEIVTLPSGAYNILFYFNYGNMVNNFLELSSLEDVSIISGSADTRSNPTNFAGTYWYAYFAAQFLYAKEPTSLPVVIKYFQRGSNPNVGIHYIFSLPKNLACTGMCENGGTLDSEICGCRCASGFYGHNCNSTCKKVCNNGQSQFTNSSCGCDCQGNTYGDSCACRYPFKGKDCQDCKVTTCQNGGTFNSSACRCSCPDGYGGLDCSFECADKVDTPTCLTNVEKGWCRTRNEKMEDECYMSCGLCKLSSKRPDNNEEKRYSVGAIAGGIVGGLIAVGIAVVIAYWRFKNKEFCTNRDGSNETKMPSVRATVGGLVGGAIAIRLFIAGIFARRRFSRRTEPVNTPDKYKASTDVSDEQSTVGRKARNFEDKAIYTNSPSVGVGVRAKLQFFEHVNTVKKDTEVTEGNKERTDQLAKL